MTSQNKIKIGIVGATGYTGVELLRLLTQHPQVEVTAITSRTEVGQSITSQFPSLRGYYDHLLFQHPEQAALNQCDLVFFATPNGIAMQEAPKLLEAGVRIIDLSADYRIQDVATWEKWYGMKHSSPEWIPHAIYGLTEWNRSAIATARLVANPGCYPTCVSLALLPFLSSGCLKKDYPLIADCKSGVSGAGRKAAIHTLLTESSDSFKAYGVTGHRHLPEIKQTIQTWQPEVADHFVFVPHLTPMIRGMQATIYAHLKDGTLPEKQLTEYYQNNPFIDIMPSGSTPETRSVRGANFCRISATPAHGSNVWIFISVIDNLVKGAAGQAIQNMNIMFGFPETTALNQVPIMP